MGNSSNSASGRRKQKTLEIKQKAKGSVDFSLKLYQKIAESKPECNIAISPVMISGSLAIVAEGARKNTAKELHNVLQLEEFTTKKEYHYLDFLDCALVTLNSDIYNDLKFTMVHSNWLLIQKSYTILDNYRRTLSHFHLCAIKLMDFMKDIENIRQTIKRDILYYSRFETKEDIPETVINPFSQFVIINAIWFQSHWCKNFIEDNTYDADFSSTNNDCTKVKMMRMTAKFNFVKNVDLQCKLIQMDFSGDRLAMFVLLPDDIQGLKIMERRLTPEILNSLMASTIGRSKVLVNLELPKFRIAMNMILNEFIKSIGIRDMFSPDDADLSGISPFVGLHVSHMLHVAVLSIQEGGDQPKAASILNKSFNTGSEAKETFKADHPFMFYIYDKQAKFILFIGRFTDPSKAVQCDILKGS